MSLRIVQLTAAGRTYTGQPIPQPTARAVADQVAQAIRDGGGAPGRLVVFGETDGFDYTALRVTAITGVEVLRVDDPGLIRDGDIQ